MPEPGVEADRASDPGLEDFKVSSGILKLGESTFIAQGLDNLLAPRTCLMIGSKVEKGR